MERTPCLASPTARVKPTGPAPTIITGKSGVGRPEFSRICRPFNSRRAKVELLTSLVCREYHSALRILTATTTSQNYSCPRPILGCEIADWSGLSTPFCSVPNPNSSFSEESASQGQRPRPCDGLDVHFVTRARPPFLEATSQRG